MTYSPFFQVLYDQRAPVGHLGRGAHYSVLRAPVWHDEALHPLKQTQLRDFAVIWDEDHDERVIEAVEALYFEGLLSPVKYIGERKGTLTVLVSGHNKALRTEAALTRYAEAVNRISQALDDPWPAIVDIHQSMEHSIIHDEPGLVMVYLTHIQILWDLSLKPITEHISGSVAQRASEQWDAARQSRVLDSLQGKPEDGEIPF
jgi:hypothetical protein